MTYLTTFERHALRKGLEQGLEKGRQEGRQEGQKDGFRLGWEAALKALVLTRFPDWKPSWNRHLESLDDADLLQDWLKLAAASPSGAAFLRSIGKRPR